MFYKEYSDNGKRIKRPNNGKTGDIFLKESDREIKAKHIVRLKKNIVLKVNISYFKFYFSIFLLE